MPEISVIIPTYNRGHLISETIDSVLSQSFRDLEILVIDDGSTDNTQEILKKYSGNVTYINIKHSGLPAVVRNVGLKHARGIYIAFLDSDDIWLPEKLEKEIGILENSPDTGLVCSNAYVLKANEDREKELYLKENQGKSGHVLADLLKDNFIINSSVLVRRSAIDQAAIFSENPELRALEDYDLWLRIAMITKICFILEPLLSYRDHGGSIRMQQTSLSYINAMISIQKQIRALIMALDHHDNEMKKIMDDINYSIALYEYDRSMASNNKTLSVGGLIRLATIRPINLVDICRYAINRLAKRKVVCSIAIFVSPWTSRT